MMAKKHKTKAEKQHLDRVAAMGCIVCLDRGIEDSPAEIHHILRGTGMGQKSSHYETLPLCHRHHRTGPRGTAIHAGLAIWEQTNGTEAQLLARVRCHLGIG